MPGLPMPSVLLAGRTPIWTAQAVFAGQAVVVERNGTTWPGIHWLHGVDQSMTP